METEVKEKEEKEVNDAAVAEENQEQEQENQEQKEDFSLSDFMSEDEDQEEEEQERREDPNNESQEQSQEEEENDDESMFSWDTESQEQENQEQEQEQENQEEEQQEEEQEQEASSLQAPEVVSKFKELGVEGENIDQVLESVKEIIATRNSYERNSIEDKQIKAWKDYLSLEDEELVLKNWEVQGIAEDERNTLLSDLRAGKGVRLEAVNIRQSLRRSITGRQDAIKLKESETKAKRQEKIRQAHLNLENHLNESTTMLGFEMAKKKENLPEVRKNHLQYISSGTFADEIFSTPENVSEAAWLWKHKDQLISALKNKGVQTGRQEIIDKLENPTSETRISHENSEDYKEDFNIRDFMSEDEQM